MDSSLVMPMVIRPKRAALAEMASALRRSFWALTLPPVVLGGIYFGIVTTTEAAAIGADREVAGEYFGIHGGEHVLAGDSRVGFREMVVGQIGCGPRGGGVILRLGGGSEHGAHRRTAGDRHQRVVSIA